MVFRNLRERFCIDDQDYQVDASPPLNTRTAIWLLNLTSGGLGLLLLSEIVPVCAELSDQERSAQQRLSGSLRKPLPHHLRPPLRHQNRVQRRHS